MVNLNDIGLLTEYESILLGNRKDFTTTYLSQPFAQHTCLTLFRYVFEDLLEWTPEMIQYHLTMDIIKKLHLEKPFKKLYYPPELDKEHDLFYLVCLLYPDKFKYSKREIIIRVYEKVLNGTLKKFPKNFFKGIDGAMNLGICMQYAINQNLHVSSIRELYMYFSNLSKINTFLRNVKLYTPCIENYEYPIDMLHDCLSELDKNELFYYYCRFLVDFRITKERRIS